MVRRGWDAFAAWRDLRMGESGDLWHRAIIDPTLRRVVGPVRGLRVLDLACGNGYLTRRWAREGAIAVGVDRSGPTLAFALRRERARPSGAKFLRQDAAHLTAFRDRAFDLVVANMALMDIRDAEAATREVGRVLAPGGRFVFSICHPCFDLDEQSAWVVERQPYRETVWRKIRGYREERATRGVWKISDTEWAHTPIYHRTLPTYVRYVRQAGLAVIRMEEPMPLPEAQRGSSQGRFLLEIPLHLVVEAIRWDAPSPGPPTRVTAPGSRTSARTAPTAARPSGSGGRRRGTGSRRPGSTPGS
jgi:SAM-dependent methyltransferase